MSDLSHQNSIINYVMATCHVYWNATLAHHNIVSELSVMLTLEILITCRKNIKPFKTFFVEFAYTSRCSQTATALMFGFPRFKLELCKNLLFSLTSCSCKVKPMNLLCTVSEILAYSGLQLRRFDLKFLPGVGIKCYV